MTSSATITAGSSQRCARRRCAGVMLGRTWVPCGWYMRGSRGLCQPTAAAEPSGSGISRRPCRARRERPRSSASARSCARPLLTPARGRPGAHGRRRRRTRLPPRATAVGIDVSETMLARAVAMTSAAGLPNAAYVRGDAEELAFSDGAFDAVCCFAALHLFSDPLRALDRTRSVLRPGGRVAILTSARRAPRPLRAAESALAAATGMRLFGRDEVVAALRARGFDELEWRLAGVTQFVAGRRV